MATSAPPAPELALQQAQPTQRRSLLESMASQYGLDAKTFEQVLLKTVFPADKQVTREQMAAFCTVADTYKLNPMTREIYAFPAKGGGIIPILGVDGWISLVQRQPDYDGHEFVETWADGKVGGTLLAMTCIIYRKSFSRPVKMTEWMSECVRQTDQWKGKPVRMLTHKAFIQAARYAFGFSGIYDEDEAKVILEGETVAQPKPIALPQRVQAAPRPVMIEAAAPAQMQHEMSPQQQQYVVYAEGPAQTEVDAAYSSLASNLFEGDPSPEQTPAENLDAEPVEDAQPAAAAPVPTIGQGRAKRIYAILRQHKKHSENDLHDSWLKPRNLDHLSDLPLDLNEQVAQWAEGL